NDCVRLKVARADRLQGIGGFEEYRLLAGCDQWQIRIARDPIKWLARRSDLRDAQKICQPWQVDIGGKVELRNYFIRLPRVQRVETVDFWEVVQQVANPMQRHAPAEAVVGR